jgi:hypothetical protein
MILAPSLKHIWDKHKTELLQLYAVEQSPRIEHKELEKRFVDTLGMQWRGWPKNLPVPTLRNGRANEYLMWLSAGLTSDELNKLIDKADELLTAGITSGKNAAKLGYILQEMRDRGKMIVHHELEVNFVCCLLVREDEDPAVFNDQIHKEKVSYILAELEKGNFHFFFHLPELQNSLQRHRFTKEEWIQYYEESVIRIKTTSQVLKTILSASASKPPVKTSKKV